MAKRPPDYLERLERAAEMVRNGMTQTEASQAAGVAQGNLSAYLRGKYRASQSDFTIERLRAECADVVRRAYANITTACTIPARFPCRVVFLDDSPYPYALDHARGGPWSEIRMACGYWLAVFDANGRIDLTESRAVHLGWARLPR